MNKKLVVLALALCGATASFADDACVPCEVIDAAKNWLQSLMSCDPNEITGPAGVGEKRYVKHGEWMDYTIYFENKSDATAAAQEIRVTLPKDPGLDWSTLELGEVAFGDNIDSWFAGKASGENTYAPSGSDTQVKTVVTVTDETVEWYLRSWDPNTPDHYPANVADGFLPPNDPDTHCGEGHVRFRVKVKDAASIGSKINASATIVFDANPPIMTDPAWWNTVAQMQGVKVTVDDVETTLDLIVGLPYGKLPDPGTPPEGHSFGGWFTQPDGKGRQITADSLVEAGDERLCQYWIPIKCEPVLFDSFAPGAINEKGATYNGFLGEDSLGGTFTLVVKKPKKGSTAGAATLTKIDPATGKKVKVTGTVDVNTGVCGGDLAGLELNAQGVGGSLGGVPAQGAVDAAKAKDREALAAMKGFDKQVYGLVFADADGEAAYLTATFSTKGKVKVAGSYRGAKVSGSATMSVGDRCAVPFVWSKKGVTVTFVLWFDKATRALVDVSGLGAGAALVDAGLAGGLATTYPFALDETAVRASVPDAIDETFLPLSIAFTGKKFDAGKAAKVSYKKGVLTVDTSKGDNVTGLKLSYSKGVLKGSFTVYAVTGGKLVKNKFTVAGVLIDGVGYAAGTNKKLEAIPLVLAK